MSYYCIKTLRMLQVAHRANISNPIEAIYLNASAVGQNIELQIMATTS